MAKEPPKLPADLALDVIEGMDREFHEQSDRIVAVVGGAYLDAMLESLLRAVFIDKPDEAEAMLGSNAPLGSNGSKYRLAYCLGLITKEQRDDLKLIGNIRNQFAHNFATCAFDAAPVRDWCSSLRQPVILAAMPKQMFSDDTARLASQYVQDLTATPREKFRMTVIGLFGALYRRVTYARRATPGGWFSYDPDALTGPSTKEGGA